LQEELTRSIKLSKTNTMTSTEFSVGASDRANKILAFDTNGEIAVTQELGTFRGNWATATSYAGRDLVKDTSTNNIFIVNTAHTSSGSQPLTTNANSALYELIVDAASASTSATAAAASASTATTQATNAASSASAASSSASAASSSASSASSAVTAAQAAQAAAELALDNFDDIYLGAFASNPTLDNDGGALTAGDLYFNTASSALQVYSGSAWQAAAVSTAGFATLTGAETFTNKTLTSPIINTAPSPTFTTAITLNATGELRLADTDSSNYVGFKSPGTVSTNKIWTLPSVDGSANQALITNGSGVLSFAAAGISWQSVQTTGFTAVAGRGYPLNTTSAGFTVTLPASPSVGDTIVLVDYAGTFATNNITLGANSNKIEGGTSNKLLTTNREAITLTYVDSTQGWVSSSASNYGTQSIDPIIYSIDFLVVAGGGGGGSDNHVPFRGAGGGGAGGYRTSTQSVNGGTVITITVGDGGAGGGADPNVIGTNGSNSSISGSGLTTITSTGGGGGGGHAVSFQTSGQAGGSGGGAPNGQSGGAGNTPSTSPSQGNNGAAGGDAPYSGSGGGGAGAAGGSVNGATGGAGGAGTASSITGSSVTRAGGGGGNGYTTGGAGGDGGGGAGGSGEPGAGSNGTANTGGGGGGASGVVGSGGKGVVILSMPSGNFSGTTTGSPTESTSGGNKILVFNGSGSYTA
jgi:hypothetical protein